MSVMTPHNPITYKLMVGPVVHIALNIALSVRMVKKLIINCV